MINNYLANQAFKSGSQEWYTPEPIIESAREVMGDIVLDPASCEIAQRWIKARYFITPERELDGLQIRWDAKTIWLNPPFNQSGEWVAKLLTEWGRMHFDEAIVLLKFVPNYKWFQPLKRFPMVVSSERVSFWTDYNKPGDSRMDNAICFVYFGPSAKVEKFAKVFCKFGDYVTFVKVS